MRSIAIQVFEEKYRDVAESFAKKLGLDVFCGSENDIKEALVSFPLLLCCESDKWFLRQNIHYYLNEAVDNQSIKKIKKSMLGDLHLDFMSGSLKHRFIYGGGKGQDIAKAVGIAKSKSLSVLDATAGLGRDAFVLSSLGCDVVMCEAHPIIHFLLDQALTSGITRLEQANKDQSNEDEQYLHTVLNRMSLKHDNSLTLIEKKEHAWDVIYLDPMFPERNKSAKVKKEMQYLHYLLEPQSDLEHFELLDAALKSNCSRVVVKRPSHAPHLTSSHKPSYSIKGKSTRFDVYALKSLN